MSCGGRLMLSNDINDATIASPNYPSPPPAHAECDWIVMVPTGHAVQLDFTATFDLARSGGLVSLIWLGLVRLG